MYKNVLQPALHRRFIATLLMLGGLAYVYAIALANWNSREYMIEHARRRNLETA